MTCEEFEGMPPPWTLTRAEVAAGVAHLISCRSCRNSVGIKANEARQTIDKSALASLSAEARLMHERICADDEARRVMKGEK